MASPLRCTADARRLISAKRQAAKITPQRALPKNRVYTLIKRPLPGVVTDDGNSACGKGNVRAMFLPNTCRATRVHWARIRSRQFTPVDVPLDRQCSDCAACSGKVNTDSKRSRRCRMQPTDIAPVLFRSNRSNPPRQEPRIFLGVSGLREDKSDHVQRDCRKWRRSCPFKPRSRVPRAA